MSLRKKAKKLAKKVGRKAQSVTAKIVKPVTGVLSAAATVLLGPAAGAAIAGAGAGIARVTGATAARAKGLKGKDARKKGRTLAKKTLKIGLLGTGVGALGSAAVSAVSGGNVLEGVGLGQLGSKILGSKPAEVANPSDVYDGPPPEESNMSLLDQVGDLVSNPGQKAADEGILGKGLDIFRRLRGGKSEEVSDTSKASADDGKLLGMPKGVVLLGAGALALVLLMRRRRGA